ISQLFGAFRQPLPHRQHRPGIVDERRAGMRVPFDRRADAREADVEIDDVAAVLEKFAIAGVEITLKPAGRDRAYPHRTRHGECGWVAPRTDRNAPPG